MNPQPDEVDSASGPPCPCASAAGRLAFLCALTLGAGLGIVAWYLPEAPRTLPRLVREALPQSGVENPVTAVLLNFRGYDTLLEVAVLLLAAVGARAVNGSRAVRASPPAPDLFLAAFFRLMAPLAIVVAAYLLWVGKHAPGGAFQAGAVLAAVGIMAALTHGFAPRSGSRRLDWALTGGLLAFCLVGAACLHRGGHFLGYPPAWAGALILVIEAAAALSIAAALVGLFIACLEPTSHRPPPSEPPIPAQGSGGDA